MNKETLFNLIDKDMKELQLLLDSFVEMDKIPPAIIRLASSKVANVITCINDIVEQDGHLLSLTKTEAISNFVTQTANEPLVAAPLYDENTSDEDNVEVEFVFDEESLEENILPDYSAESVEEDATPENIMEDAGDVEVEFIYDEDDALEADTSDLEEKCEVEPRSEQVEEPLDSYYNPFDSSLEEEPAETEVEPIIEVQPESLPEVEPFVEDPEEDDKLQVVYNSDDDEEEAEASVSCESEIIEESQESKTIVESISAPDSVYDKIQKSNDDSLSATILKQKLADLRLGINIADRFRYQRELFAGNGEMMNKTLGDLNECGDLPSAMAYVETKFKWDFENVNVKDFINLLERRFIE